MSYKPAQVAKLIGISVQGVRDWSKQYALLLSPAARGDNGQRIFSEDDVATLRAVVALRRTGMRADEIIARLQDKTSPPVVDASETVPEATPEPPQAPQPPVDAPLALHTLQTTLTTVSARIDTLERRIEAQAQESRTRAGIFALGVVAGVLLVLVFAIIANYLIGL